MNPPLSPLTLLGVGIHQTHHACHPDVGLIRGVGDEIEALKVVPKNDGEGALIWIHASNLLVAQCVRCLALANFLDG